MATLTASFLPRRSSARRSGAGIDRKAAGHHESTRIDGMVGFDFELDWERQRFLCGNRSLRKILHSLKDLGAHVASYFKDATVFVRRPRG